VVIERSLVVVVVIEAAVDAAEAVMFLSVLVGDVAKYTEFEEPALLTGVEVKEVFAEGSWLSPGSGHSLKGEWDSESVCTRLICTLESEFRS
jgi:hypothetical protein